MIILFLFWLLFAVGVGAIARSKQRSFAGFFVLSVLLSPLVGLIAVLCVRNASQLAAAGVEVEGYRKCPYCAESIRAEAVKCKHCGSEVTPAETTIEDAVAKRAPMTRDEYERAYRIGKYAS